MKEICYAYVLTNLSWHVNIFRKYSYTLCLKKTRQLWQAVVSTAVD